MPLLGFSKTFPSITIGGHLCIFGRVPEGLVDRFDFEWRYFVVKVVSGFSDTSQYALTADPLFWTFCEFWRGLCDHKVLRMAFSKVPNSLDWASLAKVFSLSHQSPKLLQTEIGVSCHGHDVKLKLEYPP